MSEYKQYPAPQTHVNAVKIARDFGEEELLGTSEFIRGAAYASESIALAIEDAIRQAPFPETKTQPFAWYWHDQHGCLYITGDDRKPDVPAGAKPLYEHAPQEQTTGLPQDVINLVIAAREFWDGNNDLSHESRALDKALTAFSERVPYENQPDEDENNG